MVKDVASKSRFKSLGGKTLLPELEYYDLLQLAERWDIGLSHIQHYVETGKLASVCWLDRCAVEYGKWKKTTLGYELFEPLSMDWFKGFVGVTADDARLAFRKGSMVQPVFYSLQEKSYVMKLVRQEDFTLSSKDICVLKSEVVHFESHILKQPHAKTQEFYLEGQTLKVGNKTYRLGEIQAKVIKQLKEVAETDNPWLHGKRLLQLANSESMQLKNIFRHQKRWRDWIESDRRGFYRLKV